MPKSWTVGSTNNLAVKKPFDSTALELKDPALGTEQATLPKVELKGGFNAALTAVLLHPDTSVELLFKDPKTQMLAVKLDYGGGVTATGQQRMDGHRSWQALKPNVLRIERSGKDKDYVIKLNDSVVGTVPLATAPGPFSQVKLAIIVNKEAKPLPLSPQITKIEIVPLE